MRLTPLAAMPPLAQGSAVSMNMNDVLFGTSFGISSSKPSLDNGRPNTSIGVSSKRLPPIRMSMSVSMHDAMEGLTVTPGVASHHSPKNMNRHVLFDAPETPEPSKLLRATSPRPFSAKRQPSGGFRKSQLSQSRPHTTMDESRLNASSSAGKSKKSPYALPAQDDRCISPVLGTRFKMQGHNGSPNRH
ncbi:hypothetical protein BC830DRAFT_951066 [Chytriomyces sp. MP71]|nr:hypothetical protein BC830DRAFT_951066 [Chytriomyces sp. MP71]